MRLATKQKSLHSKKKIYIRSKGKAMFMYGINTSHAEINIPKNFDTQP